jgi:4-amino-4-deoxy-L-arabinose transferase-like glycosyltransferase
MGRLEHKPHSVHPWVLGCIVLALLVLIGGILLTASVPPVSRDALTHHLALPKLYLKHGGLVEFPDIPFSYYPMNLDLLYLAALAFGNDIVPKYIHLVFGLFTAGLMYHYLKIRMGLMFGLLGALLWLSTPIVARLASEVYVDLGVAFFGFASIYMLIRWIESGFKTRFLIWSGVWCGLSLGTKYNALLILAILALMVPFIRSRIGSNQTQSRRKGESCTNEKGTNVHSLTPGLKDTKSVLLALTCFVGIALIVFSPWMIRNMVLKKNPIYPMFKKVFNSGDNPGMEWSRTSTMVQDTSGTMAVRHLVFKESLAYMALMPLRIFYEGRDDSPRHFDGKLNPFLLFFSIAGFLPIGIIANRLRTEQRIWSWFAVLFVLIAFFTAPIRIRYIVPALPAVVVLCMIGIFRLWEFIHKTRAPILKNIFKVVLIATIAVMLTYNISYFVDRFRKVAPLGYINGVVTRDAYITERRPEYPLIKYINDNIAADAIILGLFLGQRRYYFDCDVIFSEDLLQQSLKVTSEGGDVASKLRGQGVTHLMIRWDLFHNWMQTTLSDQEKVALDQFWHNNLQQLSGHNGYYLFQIM